MPKVTLIPGSEWKEELTKCIKGKAAYYGMSLGEVADIAGINPRTMSNRYNQPEWFTLEQVIRLCKQLKIEVVINEQGVQCRMRMKGDVAV